MSPPQTRLVLDTSLFINPEAQRLFGANVQEAVDRFLQACRAHGLELYMPSSIYRELSHFVSEDVLAAFRRVTVVRGPDLHNMQVPAAIFHYFIRDLRHRVDQGLRIAERAIENVKSPENLRWLRNHYRSAMRTGIVDSVEDLDVVLMAKEVKGIVLSEDQGIAKMAEALGIEVLSAKDFLVRYPGSKGGQPDA